MNPGPQDLQRHSPPPSQRGLGGGGRAHWGLEGGMGSPSMREKCVRKTNLPGGDRETAHEA